MIFSFLNSEQLYPAVTLFESDVFCFYPAEKSVFVPSHLWPLAVAASLKMKKNVLILETHREESPLIDFKQRWQVGEDYFWLAPRSLSVLLEAVHKFSGSYSEIKDSLAQYK